MSRIQTMVVDKYDGKVSAKCMHGLSPAVECLSNLFTCPCGYAEGLAKANYPVPAKYINELFIWQDEDPTLILSFYR